MNDNTYDANAILNAIQHALNAPHEPAPEPRPIALTTYRDRAACHDDRSIRIVAGSLAFSLTIILLACLYNVF